MTESCWPRAHLYLSFYLHCVPPTPTLLRLACTMDNQAIWRDRVPSTPVSGYCYYVYRRASSSRICVRVWSLKKASTMKQASGIRTPRLFFIFFSVFFFLFESYFVSSSGCSQTPTQPFLSCSLLCLDCGACGEGEALAFFILISGFFIMSDFSYVFCFISAGLHTTKWKRTGKKKEIKSLCVFVFFNPWKYQFTPPHALPHWGSL